MKRQLAFAATLGLAAGTACAQSSITLFGIVDATLSHGSGSVASRTQMLRGGLGTNRFGFRGTEDLGGGLAASFWLEAGFNADDGTGTGTNTNNQNSGQSTATAGTQGFTFGRRSTVSLSGNWGEVRLGRDYVPQYWNLVTSDPFGNVGVGISEAYAGIITGVTSVRSSNTVAYYSPTVLNGFALSVSHYLGENASNAANSHDGDGNGARLTYDRGPLSLSVAWGRTSYVAGDTVQRNAYAKYDFGVARIVGAIGRDEAGTLNGKSLAIGAYVPAGPGEVHASYSSYKTDAAGSPQVQKLALGYVYNLSKRTGLYGTVSHISNDDGAKLAISNSLGAVTGGTSTGVEVGIRHAF